MAIRVAFTAAVMASVLWLLVAGQPFGAVLVVLVAISLRRAVESGRTPRFVRRLVGRH